MPKKERINRFIMVIAAVYLTFVKNLLGGGLVEVRWRFSGGIKTTYLSKNQKFKSILVDVCRLGVTLRLTDA